MPEMPKPTLQQISTILRYVIVNADNVDTYPQYDTYSKALTEALTRGSPVAIMEHHYVCQDSKLVWTSDGSNRWPPPGTRR